MSVRTRTRAPQQPPPSTATAVPHVERWRRSLTWALGLLWLLDAALQFQPYMFTTAFPREVIRPAADGNPAWVSGPLEWSASLMADHIVLLNAAFAIVQLLIAVGLFRRRTVKAALAGSIAWALMVWWLGEGLGGILTGPVSPGSGLPGAVLLYAVTAVLLWPRDTVVGPASRFSRGVATTGPLGIGAVGVWLVLWLGFAAESVWAGGWTPGALGLAACFVLVAVSILGPTAAARIGITLAVVISLAVWVVAQDVGEIATGQATDPNTGPILVLLALCFWPAQRGLPPERAGAL